MFETTDGEQVAITTGVGSEVTAAPNGESADAIAAKPAAAPVVAASTDRLRDIVQNITQGIAALLALASVVYLLGGIVLAGRLSMYRLPWEIVINQLPQGFLVTIGLTEVIMPLIAVGLVYLIILFTAWKVQAVFGVTRLVPSMGLRNALLFYQRLIGPFREILLWSLFGLLVLLVIRLALHAASGWSWWEALIAGVLAVVGALATYLTLEQFKDLVQVEPPARPMFKPFRGLGTMWADPHSKPWLRGTAVAAALLPLIAWNAITLPIPYAQVCGTKSTPSATGWLIGQTSDRLILGGPDDPPGKRHIVLTPSTDATIMATYQNPKVVPLPKCPGTQ